LETLKLYHDKLLLSYGFSRSKSSAETFNVTTGKYTTAPYSVYKNLRQWGVVYKIRPTVSLFIGYNENFAINGVGLLNGVTSVLPPKLGKQTEVGVKAELLNNKLSINIAYFDIKQANNTVPSFPADLANPRILIPGVISRGFDGDWTYEVNGDLSLLGSFAFFNAKSILGPAAATVVQPYYGKIVTGSIPVQNTAELTASLFASYRFKGPRWKGLSVGLGGNYQSRKALTDGANQVMFNYIPGRTVVQLYVNYRPNQHWKYSLNVDNLLNQKYIYGVRNANVIIPGSPTNVKASATYTF